MPNIHKPGVLLDKIAVILYELYLSLEKIGQNTVYFAGKKDVHL